MQVPFYKPSLGDEEIEEVVATLKSGWLTTGPKTKQFEKEFAAYLRQKHAVALNSCTAALHLALEAIGLKAGQGVVVPTMTFAATAEVVRYFGARPILVDCRVEDFNLDVADAERKIRSALTAGESVVAIIPVHYGGQIGDVSGVRRLADRYQLKVVEDAAHCCPAYYRTTGPQDQGTADEESRKQPGEVTEGLHGPRKAESTGQTSEVSSQWSVVSSAVPSAFSLQPSALASAWLPVGHDADISCYSFYANKTITTGEGGMACTNNDDYADRMRIMSLHGISRDAWKRYTGEGSWYYEIIAPGFKYNLTDIASAIGIHQLRKSDQFHRRRTELAGLYTQLLDEVEELVLPQVQPNRIHSWHLYVIRLKLARLKIDRAQFIAELQQRGIGTSVHWMPLHLHPYYRQTYGDLERDLPTATALYPEIITLPIYPEMTETDVQYVSDSIKAIVASQLRRRAAKQKVEIGK
jgi:dTDP-4-amino-4,6-dideoxygalactose transaminase